MTAEKQRRVLTLIRAKLSDETLCPGGPAFLTSPCHSWILPEDDYQQVPQPRTPMQDQQRVAQSDEQRVGPTPTITTLDDLRQMSDTPPIVNAPNPTTKRALESTKRVHRCLTCNNVPNTVPPITRTLPRPLPPATEANSVRRSPRLGKTAQRNHNTRRPKRIPKV